MAQYGLTIEDYQAMRDTQQGACAICRRDEPGKGDRPGKHTKEFWLHVDHNHDTGEIRGLLCGACNRGIGLLNDDPALLLRAATYLG